MREGGEVGEAGNAESFAKGRAREAVDRQADWQARIPVLAALFQWSSHANTAFSS